MRYEIRPRSVVHENIDGEVVIINLETGCYYSLRDSGAVVWEGVGRGAGVEEIEASLEARYEGDDLGVAVVHLLGALEAEGLIRPASRPSMPAPVWEGARVRFEEPVLETFTDLEDLLLLDPVHEVDEDGWPRAPRG